MNPVPLNGGRPLTNLADYEVENLVAQNLPSQTFSSISVRTIWHKFPSLKEGVLTREVILQISMLQIGWNSLQAFISQILGLPNQNQSLKKDLILDQLTGKVSQSGIEEVEKAFKKCYTITLLVSDDCNWCSLKLEQSTFFLVSESLGKLAVFVLKNLNN